MSLDSRFAVHVRELTAQFPSLYAKLSLLNHGLIRTIERILLARKYRGLMYINYKPATILEFRNKGFKAQFGQDYFLLSHSLVAAQGGSFIDIGCNNPVADSNSYYFEEYCGYSGLAIDPLGDFSDQWSAQRPGTVFVNEFVSDAEDPVEFVEVSGGGDWENMLSGAAETVNIGGKAVSAQVRKVQPRSLQAILDDLEIGFDAEVLFVDVEGHELAVLRSVDWSAGKPRVIVVENTGRFRQQQPLRSFIISQGYQLIARIAIFDDVYLRSDA